jgi:glyoxylase-like metal-dependent hydrolase (beta-lactamase superfamily II)
MRIRQPGRVCDGLWCLGREESNVYLLQGDQGTMLVSGGMSGIVPEVLKQMEDFGLEERQITACLILHAHFDHVGIIPFFKRRLPDMEVYASERAWDLLGKDKVIETINLFSQVTDEQLGMSRQDHGLDLDWRDDVSGSTVREGDVLSLGDREVHILETPGHSSCSISAYVPELKALFPSDGGGIPYQDEIIPSGNSNYTRFQQSLEKLAQLEVDMVCADHCGYVTGQEAGTYIRDAQIAATEFRKLMERVYARLGDVDQAVEHLVEKTFEQRPDYFLPKDILTGVYKQMVRHIATQMESPRHS